MRLFNIRRDEMKEKKVRKNQLASLVAQEKERWEATATWILRENEEKRNTYAERQPASQRLMCGGAVPYDSTPNVSQRWIYAFTSRRSFGIKWRSSGRMNAKHWSKRAHPTSPLQTIYSPETSSAERRGFFFAQSASFCSTTSSTV